MHDQRNSDHLGHQRIGMSPVALFPERVAMVGSKHNHAVIIQAASLEKVDKLPEACIHEVQPRRIRGIEGAIGSAVNHVVLFTVDYRDVNVLWLRISEDGRGGGLSLREPSLELVQ